MTLMIGGRNLADGGPNARVQVSVDGTSVLDEAVPPGFFLRMIDLPSMSGPGDYATLEVVSDNPLLAVEQFDAQPAGRVVYGFEKAGTSREYITREPVCPGDGRRIGQCCACGLRAVDSRSACAGNRGSVLVTCHSECREQARSGHSTWGEPSRRRC
jgi:hypothetical protein